MHVELIGGAFVPVQRDNSTRRAERWASAGKRQITTGWDRGRGHAHKKSFRSRRSKSGNTLWIGIKNHLERVAIPR